MNMIRHSWAKRAMKSVYFYAACAISMGESIEVFQDTYLSSVDKANISDGQEA